MGGGVVLLYAALTVAMTYPQVTVLDRGVSVDIGDPLLSTWRLAWIAHQLPRDPLHLFDANIFYPEPRTLAYSDAMLVPSLTVAPLVWLGCLPCSRATCCCSRDSRFRARRCSCWCGR